MAPTSPEKWELHHIKTLEDNAWQAVRAMEHTAVIAGPGSGKTELLAQRACYLLETGLCPSPYKILAICYKKDAAINLKERVTVRIRDDLSSRFESITFDAFAKSFLDRFYQALPPELTITPDYSIINFTRDMINEFKQQVSIPKNYSDQQKVCTIRWDHFRKDYILGAPLSQIFSSPKTSLEWAARAFWKEQLNNTSHSTIDFPMISRLAEQTLTSNPLILKALKHTYQYVFLDEFQDTTHVQYDLLQTAFKNSGSVLTAVGDNKQQIMRWAMALDNPFERFQEDYKATSLTLTTNYRASAPLVRIQNKIANQLLSDSLQCTSANNDNIDEDFCTIWELPNRQAEAKLLARHISSLIHEKCISPRDIAILTKQRVDQFAPRLITELSNVGIQAREEAIYQDLLSEPLITLLLSYYKGAFCKLNRDDWETCLKLTTYLVGIDPHLEDTTNLEAEIDLFFTHLKTTYTNSAIELDSLTDEILKHLGEENIQASFGGYKTSEYYQRILQEFKETFHPYLTSCDSWTDAISEFEGNSSIPIMTIHKSKGLEFHTVVFLALEDDSWWSFRYDPQESISTFFVAFSRAQQSVIFTYCKTERRQNISSLYAVLQDAGVPIIDCNKKER